MSKKSKRLVSIPNLFTLSRIALIPCLILVYCLPFKSAGMLASIIFCIAGITDWLDGYLARKLNQSSPFGAFLDPVADKLIIAVALVLITGEYGAVWVTIPAAIIVSREIAISALREWMAEMGKRASVSVSYMGKVKTFTQIIAIIILLWQPAQWNNPWVIAGLACMYCAVGLTLWSMLTYMRLAWKALSPEKNIDDNSPKHLTEGAKF